MNTRVKRLSAFNYFGGKSRYLDWLLPLFPDERTYTHYLEPFCGSAVVFLNKKPSPIETINDKDGRLINFFRVLREQPDKLISQLELTPYSRAEFQFARERSVDPVEDARRFYLRALSSFGGGGGSDEGTRVNSWRTSNESRNGISKEVATYWSKVAGLKFIINRIRCAVIDNRDAFELIERVVGPETFIYADPPYDHSTRCNKKDYTHELSDEGHERLFHLLDNCGALVAVSGYDGGYMSQLYKGWTKTLGPRRRQNMNNMNKRTPKSRAAKVEKREVLWTNYNPTTKALLF